MGLVDQELSGCCLILSLCLDRQESELVFGLELDFSLRFLREANNLDKEVGLELDLCSGCGWFS